MNDLAALLGGSAAPAAPLPSGPGLPPQSDPLMAALMGGGAPMGDPMAADPMAAMMGGAPPMPGMDPMMGGMPAPGFPSTDPQAVSSILEQLLMMQQADQQNLQQQQMMTLMNDPLLEALMSGAPMAPGAGQDAQGIGAMGDIAPDAMMPV